VTGSEAPEWAVADGAVRVHEDFMSSVRSGVNGTPTFYIDGVRYDDSYDLDTLLSALEQAVQRDRSGLGVT
jgi:protein-disulfide isomerase